MMHNEYICLIVSWYCQVPYDLLLIRIVKQANSYLISAKEDIIQHPTRTYENMK